MIGSTIGIGALRENSAYREIRVSLLGSAGVVNCTGISNQCMFRLANQKSGSYDPATELELIMFWNLPFGDLVWHLST